LMFHVYFLDSIARPAGKSLSEVAADYDLLLGRPSLQLRERLHKTVHDILTKANNINDFFRGINFPIPADDKVCEALRIAMTHSRKKTYHKGTPKKYWAVDTKPTTQAAPVAEQKPLTKEEKIAALEKQLAEYRALMLKAEEELRQLKEEIPITLNETPVEDPTGAGDESNEDEEAKEKEPTP